MVSVVLIPVVPTFCFLFGGLNYLMVKLGNRLVNFLFKFFFDWFVNLVLELVFMMIDEALDVEGCRS